jgi:hypothetical protein
MPLRLPAGKRLAVNIGVDFDAMCAFSGHMATLSPSILSRGEIMLLERFIVHMKQHEDVWFATLSDIYDRWSDD